MNRSFWGMMLAALIPTAAVRAEDASAALFSPAFDPANFVSAVDHPFFPLRPGSLWIYESPNGASVDSVIVTSGMRTILGVKATVVRDREYRRGRLIEDTIDWYAQDRAGNVWYLGEDSRELQHGKFLPSSGSWEAGKNGALPEIVMKADPQIGDRYRQEYRPHQAEDMARVVGLHEKVTAPAGTFEDCLATEEWSPLDPGVRERKHYARGVGLVMERTVEGGHDEMRLTKIVKP